MEKGLDHLLGPVPGRWVSSLQVLGLIVVMLTLLQLATGEYLPEWYRLGLATPEAIFTTAYEARFLLLSSWQSSLGHLLIGILGALPGFLVGVWLATLRRWMPAVIAMLAFAMSYPRLAIAIVFAFVVYDDALAIYAFGWWVSTIYGVLFGFLAGRSLVEGLGQDAGLNEVALNYLGTRSTFFWMFVLPSSLKDLPRALMLSSGAIIGSFIFTEARVSGPGLGYEADWVSSHSMNMPLFHALAITIGLTNLMVWFCLYQLNVRYSKVITKMIAKMIEHHQLK